MSPNVDAGITKKSFVSSAFFYFCIWQRIHKSYFSDLDLLLPGTLMFPKGKQRIAINAKLSLILELGLS